jgi:MscS family membrane protein
MSLARRGSLVFWASVALLAGSAPRVHAQSPAPGASPAAAAAEKPSAGSAGDADSPRESLSRYLELCRAGDYAEAARYLGLPESERSRGPELARRLKAVLDRYLWLDLDLVSPRSAGDEGDHLPPGTDEIGRLPDRGRQDPVRMVRQEAGPEPAAWVFSEATVAHIDRWYSALPDRWMRDHLPDVLLRPGPKELLWWQWAALLLLAGVAALGGRLLAFPAQFFLRRVFSRTKTQWDDAFLDRVAAPLTLGFGLLVAWALVPSLELYEPARVFVGRVLRAAGLVAIFWALWRSVDLAVSALHASIWTERPSARALVSLGGGLAKIIVAALGVVAALSELGYPVAGLLAGLGIGGLALALAAQKTVEHLFGSLSLALDRPFDVGDFVKVEDFVGTVEAIGLRSTRFRTLDRTLITIPNGRVADMRLESFTARDRLRLACTVGLVYETTAAQMRQVLDGLEAVLRGHPRIWPDAVVVRFKEFAASSLDIEIMAWFLTREWSEFQLIRQEVLIQFMEVVERAGSSFAFPTRTVHVVGDAGLPGAEVATLPPSGQRS